LPLGATAAVFDETTSTAATNPTVSNGRFVKKKQKNNTLF